MNFTLLFTTLIIQRILSSAPSSTIGIVNLSATNENSYFEAFNSVEC